MGGTRRLWRGLLRGLSPPCHRLLRQLHADCKELQGLFCEASLALQHKGIRHGIFDAWHDRCQTGIFGSNRHPYCTSISEHARCCWPKSKKRHAPSAKPAVWKQTRRGKNGIWEVDVVKLSHQRGKMLGSARRTCMGLNR